MRGCGYASADYWASARTLTGHACAFRLAGDQGENNGHYYQETEEDENGLQDKEPSIPAFGSVLCDGSIHLLNGCRPNEKVALFALPLTCPET